MPTQPVIYAETSQGALLLIRPRAVLCGVMLLRIWLDIPALMSESDPFIDWWLTNIRVRFDPDCMVTTMEGQPIVPALAIQLGIRDA